MLVYVGLTIAFAAARTKTFLIDQTKLFLLLNKICEVRKKR